MNRNKLLAIMAEHGDRSKSLAAFLQISPQTFSAKLNQKGTSDFTLSEVRKIKEKYNLDDQQIAAIFFTA